MKTTLSPCCFVLSFPFCALLLLGFSQCSGEKSMDRETPVTGATTTKSSPAPHKTPSAKLLPEEEKQVSISVKGLTLGGTLLVPTHQQGEKLPGILLVHGSGPQNRDEEIVQAGFTFRPFKELALGLVKQGYVVLRYDKRAFALRPKILELIKKKDKKGVAAIMADMGQDTFIRDAAGALDFLKAQPFIDHTRLVVVGHSIAGLYAKTLAAHTPLAAVILLAPEILPFREHLVHQARVQLGLVEKADKEQKGSLLYESMIKEKIEKQRKMYKEMLAGYDKAFKAIDAGKMPKGAKVLGMSLEDFRRVEELSSDLPGQYAALKPPVLYVNGKNDWICPVDAPLRFKPVLQKKTDLRLVILEDMNHFLYTNTPIAFSAELSKTIHNWLRPILKKTSKK